MWTIENDGGVFDGLKLWLVPGKKYLFGRTVSENGQFVISDKSVSRQHLTIEVANVGPDDCRNPKSRSRVTLRDQNTKVGTTVNGEQIKGKESHELSNDMNEICIGKYKHVFRITWYPVALSFSFSSKELKTNPLEKLYAIFSPLDIKVLTEYESDATTHVVVKKRNTAKGLRALINGRFIVDNDPFIKAIVDATTPESDGKCGLEKAFNERFPDAIEYLPERGSEPTDEPATSYAPDPLRETMFEGYTFVFYDKAQFETLLAPITDGHGKALFREVTPLQTSVDEFVRYVKNVAGEKGVGEFEDGSEGKGVVVVGFYPTKGDGIEWFQDFARQVALNLDHRLIVQSEFLDAVLKKDASLLRRPLEVEMSGTVAPDPTPDTRGLKGKPSKPIPVPSPKSSPLAPSNPTPSAASSMASVPKNAMSHDTQLRRGRSRRAITSRFSGFDDDDDDDLPSAPPSLAPISEAMVVEEQHPEESQGLFVSQDPNREPDSYRAYSQSVEPESPTQSAQSTRTTRKRAASPRIVEEKSYMDNFAPATASFKRQRRERGEPTPPPPAIKKEIVIPEPIKKKEKKEVDILALAAQQRERAEAAAKAERESLKHPVSTIDIEEMRKLTIVEDMEVRRSRPAPKTSRHLDESERWDDKWNGRKNFKKFRRRGVEGGPVRARSKVIVPLEEVKKKGHGIGDEYWGLEKEENDSQHRRKNGKGRDTLTQAKTQEPEASASSRSKTTTKTKTQMRKSVREINSDNEDEELPENPMNALSQIEDQEIIPESEHEEDEVDHDAFRPTPLSTPVLAGRNSKTMGKSAVQGVSSRNVGVEVEVDGSRSGSRSASASASASASTGVGTSTSGNKRVAANPLMRAVPAKRARVTPAAVRKEVGDSDSDEDRFRFR